MSKRAKFLELAIGVTLWCVGSAVLWASGKLTGHNEPATQLEGELENDECTENICGGFDRGSSPVAHRGSTVRQQE